MEVENGRWFLEEEPVRKDSCVYSCLLTLLAQLYEYTLLCMYIAVFVSYNDFETLAFIYLVAHFENIGIDRSGCSLYPLRLVGH